MRKLQFIHKAVLRAESSWSSVAGSVVSISPGSQTLDAALVPPAEYSGAEMGQYFVVTVAIDNADGKLRDGMTGIAKIFGRRRGMFSLLLQPVVHAVARRMW